MPHHAHVPDKIADLELPLPNDIAQITAEAEEAVRALNRVPPKLGSLETLARQLLRAESVASSRIEGLELSHRRLAKAAFARDASEDVTAASVIANMRAMEEAVRLSSDGRALTVNDLRKIHRILFSAFKDARAGQLRTEQNWIGGNSSSPRDAEFVPPPPGHVLALLEDLCAFLRRDDLPAVIQAAIAHAQFETIHPFADGNGRVGRCLIHIVLRRRRIASSYVARDQREGLRRRVEGLPRRTPRRLVRNLRGSRADGERRGRALRGNRRQASSPLARGRR